MTKAERRGDEIVEMEEVCEVTRGKVKRERKRWRKKWKAIKVREEEGTRKEW